MMNDRSAHVGTVVATIVGPPVIATAIVWASVWATGTYFPQLGAHETPSTVGQGSFDRRFELASHETPSTANNPQQSWGFAGEPPEAVIKDFGTRDGTS
jgi:hypothetical protein